MEKTFKENVWPIICNELSKKRISYIKTPGIYPETKAWIETHYHEIRITLEDPTRPPIYDSNVPWGCSLRIKRQKESLEIIMNLEIYLPKILAIQHVLAILENPCFDIPIPLTIENLIYPSSHYCLHFKNTISHDYSIRLPKQIAMLDEIVDTLYIIEKNPKEKLLEKLTGLLAKYQAD